MFDKPIVPMELKHAIIVPIPKPCKDQPKISSCRPITFTSVFSKTFERILANRMASFLLTEQTLHEQHHGLVPFKDNRTETCVIYKDITEAKMENNTSWGLA
ncbi:RNA-directed DNA polymerase from mobile element jockey [Trichonephila clavipes]|nr:RNA-directed DNA polymerase from mobile element jockey [Trichonephila clavipes]